MTKQALVVLACGLLPAACVSQPKPWTPDTANDQSDSPVLDDTMDLWWHMDSPPTDSRGDGDTPPTEFRGQGDALPLDESGGEVLPVEDIISVDITATELPELDVVVPPDNIEDIPVQEITTWEYVHEEHGRGTLVAVVETYNGDVLAAGFTMPTGQDSRGLLLRLDGETGELSWATENAENKQTWFTDVVENPVGDIFVSTLNFGLKTVSSTGIIKYVQSPPAELLGLLWEHLAFTSGGQLLMAGYVKQSAADQDYAGKICKLQQEGSIVWCEEYGPELKDTTDRFAATVELPSGDIFAVGSTTTSDDPNDGWVAGIAADGELIWDKRLEGPAGKLEYFLHAIATSDGGIVAVGGADAVPSDSDQYDAWIVKFDYSGNTKWKLVMEDDFLDIAMKVIELPSGDFLVVVYCIGPGDARFGRFLRISPTGKHLDTVDLVLGKQLYLSDAVLSSDGGLLLVGRHNATADFNQERPWVKKMLLPW